MQITMRNCNFCMEHLDELCKGMVPTAIVLAASCQGRASGIVKIIAQVKVVED